MPSSRQRETAPRLVSSRPSLHAHPSQGANESDARPSIPAPCVNVARRSRDGAPARPRKGRDGRTAVEGTRAGMRAVCASRYRERVGATTYRRRSGIVTAGPGRLERARSWGPPASRRRRLGSGRPARFTMCGVEAISADPGALSLARNRDARLPRRRQGRQRWSERSTEHGKTTPDLRASPTHRSAHGVVKRRPHRSPLCPFVARREGRTR